MNGPYQIFGLFIWPVVAIMSAEAVSAVYAVAIFTTYCWEGVR